MEINKRIRKSRTFLSLNPFRSLESHTFTSAALQVQEINVTTGRAFPSSRYFISIHSPTTRIRRLKCNHFFALVNCLSSKRNADRSNENAPDAKRRWTSKSEMERNATRANRIIVAGSE